MAEIIKHLYQFKRGTSEDWQLLNPILMQGEPGFEYDTGKIKIGDGFTPWNLLGYSSLSYMDLIPLEENIAQNKQDISNVVLKFNEKQDNLKTGQGIKIENNIISTNNDIPIIFTGSEISIESPQMILVITDNILSDSNGNITIEKLPYKIGDIYINTIENRVYQCFNIEVFDNINHYSFIGLNYSPDIVYNAKSENAQSGIAVASAIQQLSNKLSVIENLLQNTEVHEGEILRIINGIPTWTPLINIEGVAF